MKKTLLAFLFLAMGAMPALAASPPQLQPKILLIDRQAILRLSKVGQDVQRQIEAYSQKVKAEVAGQQRSLAAEADKLQQQVAILAADVKAKRIKAFENKQAGMRASAERKEQMIQGGMIKAQQTIAQALEPILQGLMKQRGANMILDRNAVVYASPEAVKALDITAQAIGELNKMLPKLKVSLVAPPSARKK